MSKYTQDQLRLMAQEALRNRAHVLFQSLVVRITLRTNLSHMSVVRKIEELAR